MVKNKNNKANNMKVMKFRQDYFNVMLKSYIECIVAEIK